MKKVIAGPVEGATIGNILVQAMAMGKIENLDEARKLVKESFPGKVYNSMSQGPATEKQYAHYLQLKNN